MTDCTPPPLLFQPHAGREVVADFDGGTITSDAGGLLLREVEHRFGIVRQFAQCFTDHRDEELIEFSLEELLLQRVMGLALRAKQGVPEELILDFDATDDPIHGDQLGKFFHGYYKNYCDLPLYAFCDGSPLLALLRPSNIDASSGTVESLARIVPRLRQAWPAVRIIVRGDSGFCREPIMTWCEQNGVEYVFGLAKNKRLLKIIGKELHEAQVLFEQTQASSRVFKDFEYRTQKSWSRGRRVIGKAEHLARGSNPRFVVTSLPSERLDARALYEELYCAGEGDGEPDQGAAAVPVRRPDQHARPAVQSVAGVVFDDGVRAASGAAGIWAQGNLAGPGSGQHNSHEAVEDRGPDPGERAAGGAVTVRGVSVPGGV